MFNGKFLRHMVFFALILMGALCLLPLTARADETKETKVEKIQTAGNGDPDKTGENLKELTLEDAVKIGLYTNRLIVQHQAKIAQSEKDVKIAGSYLQPRVNVSQIQMGTNNPLNSFGFKLMQRRATMMDFNPDLLNHPDSSWNSQTKISLMMPIYNRTINLRRSMASVEVEVKKKGLHRTMEQVKYNIIEAYYNALLAREAVGVMSFAKKVAKEGIRVVNLLYKHQMALELDKDKAVKFATDMEKEYRIAIDNREMALANLCFTMGVDVNREFKLKQPIDSEYFEGKTLEDLQKTALKNRSDYLALNDKKEQLKLMDETIKSGGEPTLSLGTEYNWDAERFGKDLQGSWLLGLRLDLNVFDGSQRAYESQKVKEQQKELQAGKEMMAQGIKMSVEKAWRDYRSASAILESSESALKEARTNLHVTQSRYKNKFATYFHLQQAQLGFMKAKLGVLQAQYEMQIKNAKLAFTVGGKKFLDYKTNSGDKEVKESSEKSNQKQKNQGETKNENS